MAAKHFTTLDGLRGVAACSVMFMHVTLWFATEHLLTGAFLAVDFFFCLSGFVVAHAYQQRLRNGMSLRQFMIVRLIRLYPLILLGLLVGTLFVTLRLFDSHSFATDRYGLIDVLRSLCLSLLLIPSFNANISSTMFPLDGVIWSLFFEIIANIVYAAILRTQKRFAIVTLALLFLGSLIWALTLPSMEGGFEPTNFIAGFPRVGVSFFLGVLLFHFWQRFHQHIRGRQLGHPALLTLAMLAAFLFPSWSGNFLTAQLLCILLLFPAIIYFGATHEDEGNWKKICALLGALSYPLYIMHGPIIMMGVGTLKRVPIFTGTSDPKLLVSLSALTIAVSWLTLLAYDEPVRRWLSQLAKR